MTNREGLRAIANRNLERRLHDLRKADDLTRPPRGWIKAIREALGMTTAQLARRLGVSQSNISQLEKAEVADRVTLTTLRQVAQGLNCTLTYALVPIGPLDELVHERAARVADRLLARTDHTMKLENQGLGESDLKLERERLVAELLRGDPRRLWDES